MATATKKPPPGSVLPIKSAAAFLSWLHAQLGKPYQFGAAGPGAFDCSGLVFDGLNTIGIKNVPRTSEGQWAWTQHINQSQIRPGDLVFSQWPGDNASPGHVQVYIGGGKVLGANHSGAPVQITSLSGDAGHIVGFGRVPGMAAGGSLTQPNQAPAGSSGPSGAQLSGILSEAGDLLHGVAEVLDFVFGFFAPGQGFRLAAGAVAVGAGYGAVRTYNSGTGPVGGSQFPLAVGLAGVSTLAAFMALRPWPQQGTGPERPGEYVAEILSGQPPPPGPQRVHETDTIEAGLAVFATAWLASKAATGISGIIGGIAGFLAALGGGAGGEAPPVEAVP